VGLALKTWDESMGQMRVWGMGEGCSWDFKCELWDGWMGRTEDRDFLSVGLRLAYAMCNKRCWVRVVGYPICDSILLLRRTSR